MRRTGSNGRAHEHATLVGLAMGIFACEAPSTSSPETPSVEPGFVVSIPVPVRTLTDVIILGASPLEITSVYAVGTDGTILHFDGDTWAREDSSVTVDLESVSGIIDDAGVEHVFAVGGDGTVLRRAEEERWANVPSGVSEHLFGVWVRRPDEAFAVGDRGRVLRWDGAVLVPLTDEVLIETGAFDEGEAVAFPIAEPLKAVMGRDEELFVVGPRGTIYRFDGTRFQREDSGTNRPLADVFTRAGVWAAATDGVLLRRHDDGWRDDGFVAPVPIFFQGVWARNDDDVFAVGLAPELVHRHNGAWSITSLEPGVALRAIDGVELPNPPPEDAVDVGSVLAGERRQIIAVGAGGRVVRGPSVRAKDSEVALRTVAAEDSELR
jgi:hypothetical protein